tara:strand:- start:54 stop:224 length:171 start_codon:yes stop_codon:yes gene_type:complete
MSLKVTDFSTGITRKEVNNSIIIAGNTIKIVDDPVAIVLIVNKISDLHLPLLTLVI